MADRLRGLKLAGAPLPFALPVDEPFDKAALAARLTALGSVETDALPSGRRLKGDIPVGPEVRAKRLAAALVPLGAEYPMPFFRGPSR